MFQFASAPACQTNRICTHFPLLNLLPLCWVLCPTLLQPKKARPRHFILCNQRVRTHCPIFLTHRNTSKWGFESIGRFFLCVCACFVSGQVSTANTAGSSPQKSNHMSGSPAYMGSEVQSSSKLAGFVCSWITMNERASLCVNWGQHGAIHSQEFATGVWQGPWRRAVWCADTDKNVFFLKWLAKEEQKMVNNWRKKRTET